MEKLGDLAGAQVPGLGWLEQRALPVLLSSLFGGRPYARRNRTVSSVLPRLAVTRCIPVRLGSRPVSRMTLTSLPLLALTWSLTRHLPRWLPLKQLACTVIVLLGGMLGRPVVTASGRNRYCAPGRGSRFASYPQVELVPCRRHQMPALVDTSKTMEGGTST
jgi:hypothetical protein